MNVPSDRPRPSSSLVLSPLRPPACGVAVLALLPALLPAFLLCPVAALATTPLVTSVSPGAASPGDVVVLDGSDLNGPAEEYFAWVQTPGGGLVLDAPANAGTGLAVLVGPAAEATTGNVELWRGYGHALAPKTLLVDGRLISALDTRVFVGQEEAPGGPSFTVLSTSPWAMESGLGPDGLGLDLQGLYPDPLGQGNQSIRVDAAIKTRGSKTGSGDGPTGTQGDGGDVWSDVGLHKSGGEPGPAWAFQLRVELDAPYLDGAGLSGLERLAAALAELLNQQLGSLGLVATASGSVLTLDSVGGVEGGFVTLAVEAP